ncbi:MAG: hypothetical protein M3P85_07545 [Actinomycetota bacterium]|nr:hypothetical protein [Actinomycetota bacterium]
MGSTAVRRRSVAVAFGTLAAVLMLASAAFACTTFKGEFSLSQGGVTKTNIGSNTNMGFCPNTTVNTMGLTGLDSFTVSVAPTTTNLCAASLTKSVYDIKHANSTLVRDCMNETNFAEDLTVSGGSGSQVVSAGQLALTDNTVCIADPSFAEGHAMQVVVT